MIADRTNTPVAERRASRQRAPGEHGRRLRDGSRGDSRAFGSRGVGERRRSFKIVRGLQGTAREALTATNEGLKAADEGAALASAADRALTSILQGSTRLEDHRT